jgi:hypothetical protein
MQEPVMNALRVSFLLATDILVIAMLVSLLAGCVSTPQQRDRNGDFVSHIASTGIDARDAAPHASIAVPKAS